MSYKNIITWDKINQIRLWEPLEIQTIQPKKYMKYAKEFVYAGHKISDIGLLWSKITIFIIEITLKLYLHTKYGWNNPNWGRLGLISPKLHFLGLSGSSKFTTYTNIQIHVTGSIFFVIWFFLILLTMSSIRINNNWNYKKTPKYLVNDPLEFKHCSISAVRCGAYITHELPVC